ncbi:MAG TPA: YDG domain-containing protein, partial [Rhodanobacter sp.]|nr:YDG domain-containing protein [Rhodanobacter sp.]
ASKGTTRVYGYALASTSASANIGNITAKTLTLGAGSIQDKIYDGTATATLGTVTLEGVVDGDNVLFGGASNLLFADRNAGTGKQVNIGTIGLGGTDSTNYTVDRVAYADIAQRALTMNVAVDDKVYDGDTAATLAGSSLGNLVLGDDISAVTSATFTDKNAGDHKDVVVTAALGGNDASNYVLDAATGNPRASTASITPKTVDAGTLSVANKVYDGSRNATASTSGIIGTVGGDDLSLVLSGQYDNKDVGTDKQVALALGLAGGDAGNYQLASTAATSTGSITRRTIDAGTLSVAGKVYDGNRNATIGTSGLVGAVAGDDLALDLTGQYDDKNAGRGKQVAVSLGLRGGDAGNYLLAGTTVTASGDIAQRTIEAGTLSVAGKVYDGSRDATVHSTGLVGTVDGDDLSLLLTGQYDDKNAGIGKRVDVSLGLGGGDAGNYRFASTSAQARGNVAARELVAGPVTVVDKPFDGNRDAVLVLPALQGLVHGDDVALRGQGQFDTSANAANKTVQIALSLRGADARNYTLANAQQQAVGDIAALPGRNAIDSVTQPSLGSNGTQSGATDIGAGTSPGAIAAASGALGGRTASARPQLGGSWSNPSSVQGTAGAAQGAGTSTGAGAGSGAGAGAGNGAAAGAANRGVAGAQAGNANRDGGSIGMTDFAMEQVLRNGDGVSIAVGSEPLAKPRISVLPLFTEEGQELGRFRVNDLGDSLALHPVSGTNTTAPELKQRVLVRAATRVQIDENHDASLRMELLEDGTLHIVASPNAAQLGHDDLVAYSLSAFKQQAGVTPEQVSALVLGFAD